MHCTELEKWTKEEVQKHLKEAKIDEDIRKIFLAQKIKGSALVAWSKQTDAEINQDLDNMGIAKGDYVEVIYWVRSLISSGMVNHYTHPLSSLIIPCCLSSSL